MPTTDAFIIAAIVSAFILFGAVLAWADYQTTQAKRSVAHGAAAGSEGKYGQTRTIQASNARNKELIAS